MVLSEEKHPPPQLSSMPAGLSSQQVPLLFSPPQIHFISCSFLVFISVFTQHSPWLRFRGSTATVLVISCEELRGGWGAPSSGSPLPTIACSTLPKQPRVGGAAAGAATGCGAGGFHWDGPHFVCAQWYKCKIHLAVQNIQKWPLLVFSADLRSFWSACAQIQR